MAVAGLVFQALASARDRDRFPPPGDVVDVDGFDLHIFCVGRGSPTVVFEAGAGSWSVAFREVQSSAAQTARACAYDRAGYGWSAAASGPRDGVRMAEQLHGLLAAVGESGPYVLVGASLGAHIVRIFRDRYPDDVAGLVLADGSHERQWAELPRVFADLLDEAPPALRMAGIMSRFGALRLQKGSLAGEGVHPEARGAYEAAMVGPQWYATMIQELAGVDSTEVQVQRVAPLGDLPLAVVSAGRSLDAFQSALGGRELPAGANATWMRLQRELVQLSSNSLHLVSPEATHDLVADDPGIVVDAVSRVVAAVRHDEPLSGQVAPQAQ